MKANDEKFFKNLLSEENAYFDEAHRIAYCYDATRKRFKPDGVLYPRDENDGCDESRVGNQVSV